MVSEVVKSRGRVKVTVPSEERVGEASEDVSGEPGTRVSVWLTESVSANPWVQVAGAATTWRVRV